MKLNCLYYNTTLTLIQLIVNFTTKKMENLSGTAHLFFRLITESQKNNLLMYKWRSVFAYLNGPNIELCPSRNTI
jgi:hypothetical protein